jgi:hypothetical protein
LIRCHIMAGIVLAIHASLADLQERRGHPALSWRWRERVNHVVNCSRSQPIAMELPLASSRCTASAGVVGVNYYATVRLYHAYI